MRRLVLVMLGSAAAVSGAAHARASGTTGASGASGTSGTTGPALTAGCATLRPQTDKIQIAPGRVPVLLHVPEGLSGRAPLVVVLGGDNQPGSAIAKLTGYSREADANRFLVVYPTSRGTRPSWIFNQPSDTSDVTYLRTVITTLTAAPYCADPTRVYLTGMSNGGGMAALMACDAADLLAAAAPVSGGYSTLPATCAPARPLPLIEIHGSADPVVPYGGKGTNHAGAVPSYVAGWRTRDACDATGTTTQLTSIATQYAWSCASGLKVMNVEVHGLGHDWAGEASLQPFSATAATWSFFRSFSSRS